MSARDLLFEIGTEEIPAGFMRKTIDAIAASAASSLKDLRIAHGEISSMGTPRRIAMIIRELADRQEDLEESVKGPPKNQSIDADGNYTKAALGFAKSRGVDPSELRFEQIKGVDYLFATVRESGRSTEEILPSFLEGLLKGMQFPKSMYWADPTKTFARPIRTLTALYGTDAVAFEHCGVKSGTECRGHRFLGGGSAKISSADDYVSSLEREFVIVDPARRAEMIKAGIAEIESRTGCRADDDGALLEENSFLVEYPVPFEGSFDKKYLDIPEDVLIATMKKNQRYFPMRGSDGKLAALFIGVSNNRARDMAVVREGNERVLRARLDDADFFWREDAKKSLESRLPELKKVTYQEKLGSVFEKSERSRRLAGDLAKRLGRDDASATVDRAAMLAKADLVTGMVFEFPEVQGIMGREYAKLEGEPREVCEALFEQYLPRSAGDELPRGIAGAIIGIADRVDSIMAIHKIGLAPTGSADPYALRRAARCINEVIWGLDLDVEMGQLFDDAADQLDASDGSLNAAKTFFLQRLRVQLREKGASHGVTELAVASMGLRPLQAKRMLDAFEVVGREEWFASLIQSAIRVNNILSKLSDGDRSAAASSKASFSLDAERDLDAALAKQSELVNDAIARSDWTSVCSSLADLSPAITGFFDGVLVMDEDPAKRSARLSLLLRAKSLFDQIGDFSLLKQ